MTPSLRRLPLILAGVLAGLATPVAGQSPPPFSCPDTVQQALGAFRGHYDVIIRFSTGSGWDSTRATATIDRVLGGCGLREDFHGTRYGNPYDYLAIWGANGWPEARVQRMFMHSQHGVLSIVAGGFRNDTLVLEDRYLLRGDTVVAQDRFTRPGPNGFSVLNRRTVDSGARWTTTMEARFLRRSAPP